MKMKQFVFAGLLLLSIIVKAQHVDSMLTVYKNDFQQEKLYVHFDKSIYKNGETIWFKVYILAGKSLSKYSKNFYADWYDDKGNLIKHTIHPIFESSAKGQFEVPLNYIGQTIHVKAYTRWMLNFDTAFLFNKNIVIGNNKLSIKPNQAKNFSSIHFFPEGGDLVNDLTANIAFLATDQNGKPVTVRGGIFNAANQLVDSFISVHDGMGSFSLEPTANEVYTCNWADENGNNYTTKIPSTKNMGIALTAQILKNKVVFSTTRTADATDNLKNLHVLATQNQQQIYNAAINLNNKKTIIGQIAIENLPTGILVLSIFDNNWVPIAERILFVNNHLHQFFPDLVTVKQDATKRSKNSFELTVNDTVFSNLSIAVTDANLFYDGTTNIFSQLLLSGDLKGNIYNPSYYFSNTSDSVTNHLDLVMLTHGWRRYKWEDIINKKTPSLTYAKDSDYLEIKGKVFTGGSASIKPNQMMTLIVQSKDSSKQYFVLPVKQNGNFEQKRLIFFDTVRAFYQLNNDKRLNEIASVNFQNTLPPISFSKTVALTQQIELDSLAFARNDALNKLIEQLKKDTKVPLLKEVIVTTKIKNAKEILDDKYTSGLFKDNNGYAFNVMDDATGKGSIDVLHYLQSQVPGLTMSHSLTPGDTTSLTWREGSPDIFLNEMPSDAYTIQNISMTDIAYIKVFRPPFMGAAGSGPSGAIAIYTLKPEDIKYSSQNGLNSALLNGYTSYKEFYSPDYFAVPADSQLDTRTTLYWNPFVLTDKTNKMVKIDFYNNDITKRFRIIVEGVNALGKLARIEKIIGN